MSEWLKLRVQEALDELGLGPVEAATQQGSALTRDYISDILLGKKKSLMPKGARELGRILNRPMEYFLYEEHALDGAPTRPTEASLPAPAPHSARVDSVIHVPEYDIKVSAGGGSIITAENVRGTWSVPTHILNDPTSTGRLSMVEVNGDSMTPTFFSGDRVLVDHGDTNPSPPGVFVLWDGYGTVIKRVNRIHKSNPPAVTLTSDNPVYPPYDALIDEITIVGRVKYIFARRV